MASKNFLGKIQRSWESGKKRKALNSVEWKFVHKYICRFWINDGMDTKRITKYSCSCTYLWWVWGEEYKIAIVGSGLVFRCRCRILYPFLLALYPLHSTPHRCGNRRWCAVMFCVVLCCALLGDERRPETNLQIISIRFDWNFLKTFISINIYIYFIS